MFRRGGSFFKHYSLLLLLLIPPPHMVEFPVQSLVISWEKLGMLREVMRTWTGFPKKQGTFIPDVSPR